MAEKSEPVGHGGEVAAAGAAAGLLVALEPGDGAPLHVQLESQLREAIRGGRLLPGARVPSSRALASELGVSRGVVLEAYGQLAAEGYLLASQGAPTRVAEAGLSERPPIPAGRLVPRYRHDLRPGTAPVSLFPRTAWSRALRTAVRQAAVTTLAAEDPRGEAELRDELMGYLSRVRGASPEPEHTLICTGFTHGFALICRTLAERGVEAIAVESPGWPRHELIARAAGLEPVGVPVDEHGIDVQALDAAGCEAVVLTPAHQFPTGAVLSAERRAALLAWADDADGLVVEDDYDSELRYDRGAVGALQGLMPERVCHVGSLSKRLAPALRIGWILAPSWLSGALTYGLALSAMPGVIEQLALADLLARGELDRHLRRVRLQLRARRELTLEAMATAVPGAEPAGIAAGLHAAFALPPGLDPVALERGAAARGVALELCQLPAGRAGLLVGYGDASEPALRLAIALVGEAARTV